MWCDVKFPFYCTSLSGLTLCSSETASLNLQRLDKQHRDCFNQLAQIFRSQEGSIHFYDWVNTRESILNDWSSGGRRKYGNSAASSLYCLNAICVGKGKIVWVRSWMERRVRSTEAIGGERTLDLDWIWRLQIRLFTYHTHRLSTPADPDRNGPGPTRSVVALESNL